MGGVSPLLISSKYMFFNKMLDNYTLKLFGGITFCYG